MFDLIYPYLIWTICGLVVGLLSGIFRSFSILTWTVTLIIGGTLTLTHFGFYQVTNFQLLAFLSTATAGNLIGYSFSTRNEGGKK